MIRVALDTDDLDALDGRFPILLTYSDLIETHDALAQLVQKYPASHIVLIDRGLGDPTGLATVADYEPGAIWPASELPGWFHAKKAAGLDFLTLYCDRSDRQEALDALKGAEPWEWIATLDGTLYVPALKPMERPAVIQFAGSQAAGVHADISLVIDEKWHPQP
jgi:hypothetical protein